MRVDKMTEVAAWQNLLKISIMKSYLCGFGFLSFGAVAPLAPISGYKCVGDPGKINFVMMVIGK